jgi:hypothetical protein
MRSSPPIASSITSSFKEPLNKSFGSSVGKIGWQASFYSLPAVFLHGISLFVFHRPQPKGLEHGTASIFTIRQTILTIILISISL